MTYERQENLKTKAGEAVAVELEEIPTSGYLWSVESHGGTEISRKPRDMTFGMIGGSVTATFNVKAAAPGTYNIDFVYQRPWEDRAHTRVRYVLTVAP